MYISPFLTISSFAALAVAQTTSFSITSSTTSSVCGAQPVLDACIASTTAIIQSCASTDYNCQCQKYGDLLTYNLSLFPNASLTNTHSTSCFNVCPNDPRLAAAQSSQSTYCADASIYSSSTSSAVSRSVSAAATTTTDSGTASGVATTGSSGAVRVASSTTSASSTSATAKSGAQKELLVGAGSVVLGFAGLVGAFWWRRNNICLRWSNIWAFWGNLAWSIGALWKHIYWCTLSVCASRS